MYKFFIRPFLFQFNPEKAHHITFALLKNLSILPFGISLIKLLFGKKYEGLEKNIFGLTFPGPIGLAAGLDKNAQAVDAFAAMGFDFVEIGTVTPKPQDGNPKPRLFRLPQDKALINRMGFNNDGVEVVKKR